MNTGKEIYQSKNGLVTTVAISLNGEVEYALEGSVFVGGAVIQWIRDGMHMIQDSCDSVSYTHLRGDARRRTLPVRRCSRSARR